MGKGYALLMEMGCGKSITTVAIAGRAYLNGFIRKLLIVAPKSILEVWKEEFSKFADFPYSLTVLQGSSKKKREQLLKSVKEGLQVVVVNYDSVFLIEGAITAWQPDFIVCDESTRIKNPAARTSKSVHRIARWCEYRMILTGSPITRDPLDLFSQYKMLDENIFGPSYADFKNRYGEFGDYGQPVSFRNLSELTKKTHSIAYRVTKEAALDLPETIDKLYPVMLETDAYEHYEAVIEEARREFEEGEVEESNILATIMKLQQITGGFYKPETKVDEYMHVSSAKLNALEDIIDETTAAGEKLVVMARFIPEIKAIEGLLHKKGIKYAVIYGEVRDRTAEINKFQEDPDCRVFIGQLQTASMGITLTAASTMVFYSLTYNYGDYIQSKARIHRIGQKKTCVYIHLIAKDTIDGQVMASLERKENIARIIVDRKFYKSIIMPSNSANLQRGIATAE